MRRSPFSAGRRRLGARVRPGRLASTRQRLQLALRLGCLAGLLCLGCRGGSPGGDPRLVEIPRPDLADAQPSVAGQIAEAEADIEALRNSNAPAAELAPAYGELGLVYVTYTFLDAAEASFENARILAPDDFRWPHLLGYLFQIQGRLDEAEAAFARVLELRPDDLPALIRQGTVLLELGRNQDASRLFARVVELSPNEAAGFNGLGRAAAATGDHAAAVEYFDKALELQPQASSVRYALGLSYRALGNREEAKLNLEKGGDAKVLFADPVLQRVAELGRSAELFLVRGAQAFGEQRYNQAAEFYRKALEIDPTDFTTHKALGFCLEKLGDLGGAIAQLDRALAVGATGDDAQDLLEQAEIYRIMGGLQVLAGRDREALAAFERGLELDPDRLALHMKLANALARDRRFDEALLHYDRILKDLPGNADALVKRATVLVNLGQTERALSDFESAIAAAPEDASLRLRFAEALTFVGNPKRAAAERAAALELAPEGADRAEILLTEANALVRRGALEEAIAKLEGALAADPGYTDARFELARLHGHFGRYQEALREFARVLDEVPLHRPARHGQVTVLLLLERYRDARARLEDGLAAMPRDRTLAHALARLLAAAPDDRVANGARALELARQVHAAGSTIDTATTLALALAAASDFEQAAELQRIIRAETGDQPAERRRLVQARLDAFERLARWQARAPDEIIEALVAPLPGSP